MRPVIESMGSTIGCGSPPVLKCVCFVHLVPTRSSAEVKSLLGEEFQGILSSDCWSAYGPQSASAKQKCLAHIERELKAMQSSRFVDNRHFADEVFAIFHQARQAYRAYHQQQLSLADLHLCRVSVEAQLQQLLDHPPKKGWPADAQKFGPIVRSASLGRVVHIFVLSTGQAG